MITVVNSGNEGLTRESRGNMNADIRTELKGGEKNYFVTPP
jgi:hypothetical protein